MPNTGKAIRVGLTGVPGVGKSTLIDQLGSNLTSAGHRVAVLAVDPSSVRSGGSILGDKTRMARLAVDRKAFIRPSPASGTLGGVAARTREAILLCEAAGFDVILVETVGVGQSEAAVADLTDVFVVLMLGGAGDELQGLKKGVLELADIVAVNKADGEGSARAEAAAKEYQAALHILGAASEHWSVPVLTVSGMADPGLDRLWYMILAHRRAGEASGEARPPPGPTGEMDACHDRGARHRAATQRSRDPGAVVRARGGGRRGACRPRRPPKRSGKCSSGGEPASRARHRSSRVRGSYACHGERRPRRSDNRHGNPVNARIISLAVTDQNIDQIEVETEASAQRL